MKKRKGFSLLEVIIVITLIGIIGALVIPSFLNSSTKAKLSSDIESARILQSSIDLFMLEESTFDGTSFDSVITQLNSNGYIKQSTYKAQTDGANFVFDPSTNSVSLDVSGVDSKTKEFVEKLNDNEKLFISSGTPW